VVANHKAASMRVGQAIWSRSLHAKEASMFRVPDSVPNERTTKGEQPYEDERELMGQQEEDLQEEAERLGEEGEDEQEGGGIKRLEEEAEERLDKIRRER
jgi:hypothetical protein